MAEVKTRLRFSCKNHGSIDPKFAIDTALLNVNVSNGELQHLTKELWAQSTECYKCALVKICDLTNPLMHLLVNTTFGTEIVLKMNNGTNICHRQEYHFGERGIYNMSYSGGDCKIIQMESAENSLLPIIYVATFYLLLAITYWLVTLACRKYDRIHSGIIEITPSETDPGASTIETSETFSTPSGDSATMVVPGRETEVEPPQPVTKPTTRYKFLDVFRGLSIVVMIFVNYGGGKYWFFAHSIWNGLTVADLVFPWFMFIMGTSMALSFESAARKKLPKLKIFWRIIRRSIILFLLGMFVVNQPKDWGRMRVMGVLQRFAISYLVVGLTRLVTMRDAAELRVLYYGRSKIIQFCNLLDLWVEWLILASCLSLWTVVSFLLPVPGCPSGYLGIGGLEQGGKFANCTGGAATYIDRVVLGSDHLWAFPGKKLYQTSVMTDPEGLLGCLSAIVCVILGLQAGQILLLNLEYKSRILRYCLFSLLYGALAAALCGASQNEGLIPVNKHLWTPTFVFALSALAYLIIVIIYLLTDVLQIWFGEPFYFVGMNSIAIYLGHEVFHKQLPLYWHINDETHASRLYMDLWGTTFWTCLAYLMHRNKFYVTV